MALAPQGLAPPGSADDVLKAMFDPAQWAQARRDWGRIDRAIEHLVEGPSYATLWTLDRKLLKAQQAACAMGARPGRVAAADAGRMERGDQAVRARGQRSRTARRSAAGASLTDLWVDIANETLTETHRTPEFLEAQRRLTRSSTDCRLAEREIAEAYCEMHHIPTRTEVDELQRTVYELRRDLRSLQRALRAPEASTPPKAPAQAPAQAAAGCGHRCAAAEALRENAQCPTASSSIPRKWFRSSPN